MQKNDDLSKVDEMQWGGPVLRLIRQGANISRSEYARRCQSWKSASEKQGKRSLGVDPAWISRMEEQRKIRRAYKEVLEEMMGKAEFRRWLKIVYRDRPDLFWEATVLPYGRRAPRETTATEPSGENHNEQPGSRDEEHPTTSDPESGEAG